MVEGRSKIKLYYNKACTRELEKALDGSYIYKDIILSNNALMPYVLNVWCKNDGSHNAYSVVPTILETQIAIISATMANQLKPNEIKPLVITFNIPKYDLSTKTIRLVIDYDNV